MGHPSCCSLVFAKDIDISVLAKRSGTGRYRVMAMGTGCWEDYSRKERHCATIAPPITKPDR